MGYAWDSRCFSHLTGWRGSTASQSRWDMDCTWLEGHGAMRNANGCHWFWMVLGIKVRSFLFRERSLAVWITVVRLLHSERIAPNYKKHSRQAWRPCHPCHGIIWSFNVVQFVWEGQQKHVGLGDTWGHGAGTWGGFWGGFRGHLGTLGVGLGDTWGLGHGVGLGTFLIRCHIFFK